MCNDLSVQCVLEGETGTDELLQVLTWKNHQREILVPNRQGTQQQTYGNSTWHACKYEVRKLCQRCILKKGCLQWHIYRCILKKGCLQWHTYPPFQAHSATQVCTGIRQNHIVLETYSPQIWKFAQHINTCVHGRSEISSSPCHIQVANPDPQIDSPACQRTSQKLVYSNSKIIKSRLIIEHAFIHKYISWETLCFKRYRSTKSLYVDSCLHFCCYLCT